jgi:hypothetical protein
MLCRMIVVATVIVVLAAGCGRGTYDEQVEKAIRRAKSPPEETEKTADEAAEPAGKAGEPAEK